MPDNWGFVTAAYALAALVLGGYWRWLARRERELIALTARRPAAAATDPPPGGSGRRSSSPA
jgi:ABC-type transport system involved in cytochrome c biogenesis permease subunit